MALETVDSDDPRVFILVPIQYAMFCLVTTIVAALAAAALASFHRVRSTAFALVAAALLASHANFSTWAGWGAAGAAAWCGYRALRPWLRDGAALPAAAVVVSGCDVGLGAAIALELARRGAVVYAGVLSASAGEALLRRAAELNKAEKGGVAGVVRPLLLDVTSDAQVRMMLLLLSLLLLLLALLLMLLLMLLSLESRLY